MAPTRTSSSPIFAVGESVVCVEKNCPYEAKIMNIKEHQKALNYFLHYQGWSKKYDFKVAVGNEEGRLFKGSVAEYVEQHRDEISDQFLADYDKKAKKVETPAKPVKETSAKDTPAKDAPAKKKKSEVAVAETQKTPQTKTPQTKTPQAKAPQSSAPKTPADTASAKKKKVETPADTAPAKKKKVETPAAAPAEAPAEAPPSPTTSDDEEGVTVDFDWRFDFPTNLMELCIEDRARIHLGQLTRLPAAVTIDAIVDKYEDSLGLNSDAPGTSDAAEKAEIQFITVDGVRNFFNKALHMQFLYNAEREQYREASQGDPDFRASANYGVVHLLRAYTTLAKTIKRAKLQSPFAEGLVANSKLFIEFISQNLESFGVEYYEKEEEEEA